MTISKGINKVKKLSREEKWVAEICWGGVPLDHKWIRECPKFIIEMEKFNNGEWKELYEQTKNI